VFSAVTQETVPIVDSSLLGKKVSDLRTLVTLRCGFPVSVYCLRTPQGLEMFDCNSLKAYQIETGTVSSVLLLPAPGRGCQHQGLLIPDFAPFQEKMEIWKFKCKLSTSFAYLL
jgi:hypothetical protein